MSARVGGGRRQHLCAASWFRFLRLRIGVFYGLHLVKGAMVLILELEGQRLRRPEFCGKVSVSFKCAMLCKQTYSSAMLGGKRQLSAECGAGSSDS